MERLILEITFMVFWLCMFLIRYPFYLRNKGNTIIRDKRMSIEKMTSAVTFVGMMVVPVLYVTTTWFDFADYELPLTYGILGILLISPSSYLFYRSHHDLGLNWSAALEIRKEHILITNGIYKHMRHPMYAAIWLWALCQALLLQNYIAGLSGVLGFGLHYFIRIDAEELLMEEHFGEEYRSYKERTKRLLP